jgi:hypothetical protein
MPGLGLRALIAAAAAVLLAACGGGSHATSTRAAATRKAAVARTAAVDPARCVPAAIHAGAPPSWTASAWSESSPNFRVPYALASGDAAGAFFFARTLRAGHPTNPSNKVLWIVRFPRNGHPLEVSARLGRDPSEVVRTSWPADSEPGEIYPSEVDLPTPGCWHLDLAWGSHRASIDVEVRAARHTS